MSGVGDGATGAVTFRGKTILIIEDHDDSRGLLTWTFKNLGAKVIAAASVPAGQHMVLTQPVNLIITDIALPGPSGFEFIKWLRGLKKQARPDTPCIAITAYPDLFPPTSADGFSAYMRKPLDIGRLCTVAAALVTASEGEAAR
jgi:CheY-like chemotaxis protein